VEREEQLSVICRKVMVTGKEEITVLRGVVYMVNMYNGSAHDGCRDVGLPTPTLIY